MKFGMFMVGEYLSLVLTSAMTVDDVLRRLASAGAFLPPIVWFALKAAS